MANINEILQRAASLRDETALNSISPERAGGIMYDTLIALNELWLQQGAALVISKIYASVSAMEADTAPVSDLTGQPLRPGQIVVIASSDSDNGTVYRYNGTTSPSWTSVGKIGNLEPVDSLDSDSTSLPLAAHQGKVLDGKISQLGQKTELIRATTDVPSITWSDGYYSAANLDITGGSTYKHSSPIQVKRGDALYYYCGNSYSTIAMMLETDSQGNGKKLIKQGTSTSPGIFEYVYFADHDTYVALSSYSSKVGSVIIKHYKSETIEDIYQNITNNEEEVHGLSQLIGKEKSITWLSAYVSTDGFVYSSLLSLTSQPFMLYAGESVSVTTQNSNIAIICKAKDGSTIEIGNKLTVLETTSSAELETHTYTAEENTWIVICVLKANYYYSFDTLDVDTKIKLLAHFIEDGLNDLTFTDDKNNVIVWCKNGHIKTKHFDSSTVCETIKTLSNNVHQYISAESYNQIPTDKCGYEKHCYFPTSNVLKGKFSREYEIGTSIARVALFGDLHVGYGYSFADYNHHVWKDWENYVELSFKRASGKVPDFGIALGDMLSSINKSLYERNGVGLIERNDYYNRLRSFSYPLFNVFGNHDEAIPEFTHNGVIEINNIRLIVFHMDIVHGQQFSTYNISDDDFNWLEDAVQDSYNKGYTTVLVSHYPIIGIVTEPPTRPENYFGQLLVNTHGQDLIDLCKEYDVRMHIHGHCHPTGLPYVIMNDNGIPFDMTEVEIGLGAQAYVVLEIKSDGFHFTEYPVTRRLENTIEDGVTISHYEAIEDTKGRTLFVPFYNQQSGTVRSEDWTPYPGIEILK